jgi:hypothetical protein
MDIIDGFLDSHYTFTSNDFTENNISDNFFNKQVNAVEKEIKLNHLNVMYFTFKLFQRNAFISAWRKIQNNINTADETYILIT